MGWLEEGDQSGLTNMGWLEESDQYGLINMGWFEEGDQYGSINVGWLEEGDQYGLINMGWLEEGDQCALDQALPHLRRCACTPSYPSTFPLSTISMVQTQWHLHCACGLSAREAWCDGRALDHAIPHLRRHRRIA
eukprot:1159389-Pelagomonas_calceolata.AAC.1